ncbi:Aspartic proteinase [Zea mays]|uniref:Aspartic proteinase n=2 Tax=Zea mays TaxID=4577 RepID=A0A3L6FLW1_MAIZE|nr:Aspartic proteinase [Zea mays]
MGHHHISRSYFRQTDIKRSGNASIDIMSKFFKLMVVLQLMNDLNRSVQDAAISCIEAYSVLEVLRPLYNSPKILEQKHEMLPVEYQCFIAVFLLVCPNVGKSALFNRIIASLRANQFCERLPSPNGESTIDYHQISKMPNLASTIANKTFTLTRSRLNMKTVITVPPRDLGGDLGRRPWRALDSPTPCLRRQPGASCPETIPGSIEPAVFAIEVWPPDLMSHITIGDYEDCLFSNESLNLQELLMVRTEEAAAHTYDLAALKYRESDCKLNFPILSD